MCGILAFFAGKDTENLISRTKFIDLLKRLRHRGPDWNGVYLNKEHGAIIGHERLSIVGVENGSQPIIQENIVLSVNGEIYNHKDLFSDVLENKYTNKSGSDCEVIIYLYKEFGTQCVKMLDGIFSFVLYDITNETILVARDRIGVTPLYYGTSYQNELVISSELKALSDSCDSASVFLPGFYLETTKDQFKDLKFKSYYSPDWDLYNHIENSNEELLCIKLRNSLTNAVDKRLMCEVPFGVLLSGGLDSSLVASITSRLLKTRKHTWGSNLHSFSIGLEGAPDLIMARKVATFLDTIHHEFVFTVQEGLDAIEDLVYTLETYDVTTIRASTPMYLMSRKIKAMGIKMVLSGEGADELLGGYLYFHNAPNPKEFHEECCSRVQGLFNFDCLRANKSTMAWGVEARVPFLDKDFIDLSINIHPSLKLKDKKEKYILRKAFDTPENPYLPDEILWRQKEQFSDGVGYNWIDGLQEHINNKILDNEMEDLEKVYIQDIDIPKTKEALYYRRIFDSYFPRRSNIVPRWIPNMKWDGVSYDPSGRAQKVHEKAY